MGILSSKRYVEILDKALSKNYKTFIETGTYNGRSIIPLAKEFYDVNFYTIEIVKELYLFAKNKAEDEGLQNINFYHGDSRDMLKKVLNSIGSEHVIIFLDAHSSSYEGYSVETIDLDNNENFFIKILNKMLNKKKTVTTNIKKNKLSNTEVPLLEELNLISIIYCGEFRSCFGMVKLFIKRPLKISFIASSFISFQSAKLNFSPNKS